MRIGIHYLTFVLVALISAGCQAPTARDSGGAAGSQLPKTLTTIQGNFSTDRQTVAPARPTAPTIKAIIVAMRDVPASDGIREMAKRGFVRLDDGELGRLIAGNTLKLLNTYSHFAKDNKIRLKETSLGGGLESEGTWTIKDSNLCHSVREGHEFCSGLFFRDADILCWPGFGWSPDDTDYLRRCSILAGNQTRKAPGALATIVTRRVAPRPVARKLVAQPQPTARKAATTPRVSAPVGPTPPTLDAIIAAMRRVPARDGIREMAGHGFIRLKDGELGRLIAGNTLKLLNSYSYFAKDKNIRLKETSLGGGLESTGTWSVKDSNLCHSVREGHEFCSGLFFRDAELLCWPGIGWSPDDTEYLRHCSILAGNQTRKTPGAMAAIVTRKLPQRPTVEKPTRPAPARLPAPPPVQSTPASLDQVIAAMRSVPARDGIRKMSERGFVRLRGEDLKKRMTGNTLKMVNSFSYYGGDQRIRIREMSLGGGLQSAGAWYVKGSNLCHSVREGHEFCSGIFFRGAELLCWPGIGWSPDDVDYLRTCRILAGNKSR